MHVCHKSVFYRNGLTDRAGFWQNDVSMMATAIHAKILYKLMAAFNFEPANRGFSGYAYTRQAQLSPRDRAMCRVS